ncbi:MAG: A/G-specific adenine glycosylase [Ilumatobacter sp.]|nr:A/G-specific adenine glycosylase [Ilumatobacter sp.]MDG2040701.1 A/G-specific adenine glycosylase [Ilumatobacter sp.]
MGGLTLIDPGLVLAWGIPRMRDLPWRHVRDPWMILVAEVMLQQTQVDRVIPKWEAFLDAYPSPAECADAPLGDVLRLWQGLGYPRRAKYLHATAEQVIKSHDGCLPDSLDSLLALPGIGPYTARAVLAFAFERDVAVVDTNIARVLARVAGDRLTSKVAQSAADALVPVGAGWTWNQVIMDLGALVCRPMPMCAGCPISASCEWHVGSHPKPDPAFGSAGVSTKQAPFKGSDRQRRGQVLAALSSTGRPVAEFEARIVEGLVAEGLVERRGGEVVLPE